MHDTSSPLLLAGVDPAPVSVLNPDGSSPFLLVCDHAARAVPYALGGLGVPPHEIDRHIGWDIGAAAVTEGLSRHLDAPAVLTVYSRLVVDCNRWPANPSLIPAISDGTPVPGNEQLTPKDRARRMQALYDPYHATIAERRAAIAATGRVPILISIHSFTPVMAGYVRPWHAGVLWNEDGRLALPMLAALRAEGDLVVGDNEPYSARTGTDFTLIHHGETIGIPSLMLEIRQDLIADDAGAEAWAARLARLLPMVVGTL